MSEAGAGIQISVVTLLAFIRLSAFFVSAPFPGTLAPPHARLAISAGLAWALSEDVQQDFVGREEVWLAVVAEVFLGLSMGFLLSLIMHAFAYAGELVSQPMGLRIPGFAANPLDARLSLLGSALSMIMIGLFAMGPGPLRMTIFLHRMFELVPVGAGVGFRLGSDEIVAVGSELFAGAIQVGAPLIAAVFAAQCVLAVLARSVPTLNLFIEGPALTTSAGIIGLIASINTYAPLVDQLFLRRFEQLAVWLSE